MITQCQHGVDTEAEWSNLHATRPVGPSASRSAIKSILDHSVQIRPKPVSYLSLRRFIGVGSNASESHYRSYIIYIYTPSPHLASTVLATQIYHNRLFRKKVQQNVLHMISTEVSSLATHNTGQSRQSARSIDFFAKTE
jgi:hypothetical protein